MTRQLICNKAYCKLCGTEVISHHRHDFVTCPCGALSVDGGKDYTKRLYHSTESYEERSVYSDADYSVIRENVYRGSRGVNGDEPLKWVKLSEISDDYLSNLLKYCEDNQQTECMWCGYYAQEREYRKYI